MPNEIAAAPVTSISFGLGILGCNRADETLHIPHDPTDIGVKVRVYKTPTGIAYQSLSILGGSTETGDFTVTYEQLEQGDIAQVRCRDGQDVPMIDTVLTPELESVLNQLVSDRDAVDLTVCSTAQLNVLLAHLEMVIYGDYGSMIRAREFMMAEKKASQHVPIQYMGGRYNLQKLYGSRYEVEKFEKLLSAQIARLQACRKLVEAGADSSYDYPNTNSDARALLAKMPEWESLAQLFTTLNDLLIDTQAKVVALLSEL